MKYIATLVTVLILVSPFSNAKELSVGVEGIEYYPIYNGTDGNYRGFARDLLDSFATKYGHTLTYRPYPVKRLFDTFLQGEVDLKFPANQDWAGDLKKGRTIHYSESALEYIDGSLVLPSHIGQGKARIKTLGTIRGFTPWDYLDDVNSGTIKLKEHTDFTGLTKMVQAGRIDAVYFNVLVSHYLVKQSQFGNELLKFDQSLPHTRSHYHLSSIKHPDVIEQFDEFLIAEAALVASLKAKYELVLN